MRIDGKEWKKSVEELHERLERCEKYVLSELDISDQQNQAAENLEMAAKDSKTHSYRDKNTLVEVTIHTRGKNKEPTRNLSWDRSVEKENSVKSFAKPTRASSVKNVTNSPKQVKRKKTLENNGERKSVDEDLAKQKSIRQLLEELRGNFRASGINDFYEFLDEVDGGRSRSERLNAGSTKSPKKAVKNAETVENAETVCQKLEHKQVDEEARRLGVEVNKYKAECARYKNEYDIAQKQLAINKESQASMEIQINDLKKIISKLTQNNSELLGLVSTRAGQEDQLIEAEQKISGLSKQLYAEKSRVKDYEARFLEQEGEISKLRRLTADLKAHLHHGLQGLDLPRSRPASRPQDNTRDILGITAMSEAFKGDHSQSEDSAIEDPESRQSSTPRAATRYNTNTKQTVAFQTQTNKNQPPTLQNAREHLPVQNVRENPPVQNAREHTPVQNVRENPPVHSAEVPPAVIKAREPIQKTNNVLSGSSGGRNPGAFVPESQLERIQNSKLKVQMPASVPSSQPQGPSFPPQVPPTSHTSSLIPNLTSQSFNIQPIKNSSQNQSQKMNVPPLKLPQENGQQVENLASVNPQVFDPDSEPMGSLGATFQPVPLDLSDTLSSNADRTQLDTTEYVPATVANKSSTKNPPEQNQTHFRVQQNLENKVQAFLDKLHQDSLNLSLPDLPKARSFQGPSMQLSISGGSDLDETRDTTLTEGKFLRGLETSIEVLPAEITHSSN